MIALGLIETVGYATAVSAADAAVKAANVEIVGLEKVIGVNGYVGVTVHLTGDVAAVKSAVDAGIQQAENVGQVISSEVIARAHSDVQEKLLSKFLVKEEKPKKKTATKKGRKKGTTNKKNNSSNSSESSKKEEDASKNDNGKKA
ncbi:BMC domain-containing protein [Ornithinibacillus halophilus]|uniref:Carboxysome shell and ethanolamine utilization microcompartment protein CcmL/EutN n=1 Tax=Ornithinibacillus halophilus TaxID=930117 RepID=A0A1M5FP21_9BACI|nr:BMC domain-containing protein [Ornithinibacillus halophilus]SHF92922.1 Carboxysome shell and ethanolamine utilization microcompartment protein CcmL/EutN [Ornithinibacillus halophilus]